MYLHVPICDHVSVITILICMFVFVYALTVYCCKPEIYWMHCKLESRCTYSIMLMLSVFVLYEPPRDKTNNVAVRQRRLRSAWASAQSDQTSLIRVFACAQWVAKGPSFLHADSEDADQTGRMHRLIWVFAGRTHTLLVLSRGGSYNKVGVYCCIMTTVGL